MYKAIHIQTGEEMIILHPRWRKQIETLREMDHSDLLVCQGCQQPLRVKAGEMKRPHFAHKHLKACSFGHESPEILSARAVLYEWLHRQFGENVTLEKVFEGLPRPLDCWVEGEHGHFAYWIIEAGIKLEPRTAILAAIKQLGLQVTWVFLSTMLHEEKKEFHSLLLTPTERAFLQSTPFDEMLAGVGEVGSSLHYLDVENQALTTYRALALFHRPNWFKGIKKTASLAEVRASSNDGGFLHRGETDRLRVFQEKKRRHAENLRQYNEREAEWSRHLSSRPTVGNRGKPPRRPIVNPSTPSQDAALQCVTCGQMTTDYWSTFFDDQGRKLCRCRSCLARENEA